MRIKFIVGFLLSWIVFVVFVLAIRPVSMEITMAQLIFRASSAFLSFFFMIATGWSWFRMVNSHREGVQQTYYIFKVFSNDYLSSEGQKYRKFFFSFLLVYFLLFVLIP